MIDLNDWHRRIHMVTGAMALRFNRAKPEDLAKWAGMLREIASQCLATADESPLRRFLNKATFSI
jgi:hypothetical protein